jgi:hypothetical protein
MPWEAVFDWGGGGALKARAKGPRKFLNLESLKCHFLDFGGRFDRIWSENSVLVCRNLQFSSTINNGRRRI